MRKTFSAAVVVAVSLFVALAAISCQDIQNKEGIHVMFEGTPQIYHSEIYYHGQVAGKIQDQQIGNGAVTRLTIQIDPDFKTHSGKHWIFYVENGRLTAGRLIRSGKPIKAGDRVCGFHSKSALNWFKFKTLLSDRVSKAERRADLLYHKFAQSPG